MRLVGKTKRKEWHREIRRLRELRYQISILSNPKTKSKVKSQKRLKKIFDLITEDLPKDKYEYDWRR